MKADVIEHFRLASSRVSSFTYVQSSFADQSDFLFCGTESGAIAAFPFPADVIPRNIRPIDITRDARHTAEVSCLLYSENEKFVNVQCGSLLFSGSLDRTIKVWNLSNTLDPFIQTLSGHSGTIASIADANNGSILSCSDDSTLRMWSPQRGRRSMMLNPFFECVFVFNFDQRVWVTALTTSCVGPWQCFVADSEGNIDVLEKGSDKNEVEKQAAAFMQSLTRYAKWDKVHQLGITHLEMVPDENFLTSLSFDGTCKILDPCGGQVLFLISNPRKCMYLGCQWVQERCSFYLTDESGHLEVFSTFHEKFLETIPIVSITAKQQSAIQKDHSKQALGTIQKMRHSGYFFTLVASGRKKLSVGTRKTVGVIGDVVLWNCANDVNCKEFIGHEGSVAGICVPLFLPSGVLCSTTSHVSVAESKDAFSPSASFARGNDVSNGGGSGISNGIGGARGDQHRFQTSKSLQVSREERVFYSAGHDDNSIRAWDEYDQTESYQFRNKDSEITVMITIWKMNTIVTGHENGRVVLWGSDSHYKVASNALKNTISALVEARSNHSSLLIGSDFSGKIAIWNLTLHHLNPTQFQVEALLSGFHDPEDPGILSLGFHEPSKTIFSGGNDRTIRYWRLAVENSCELVELHAESVCFMKCTNSFLLSGDEEGTLCLSSIKTIRNTASVGFHITHVTKLCVLHCATPYRCVSDIFELNHNHAIVLQVGGNGNGRTRLWDVHTHPRKVRSGRAAYSVAEMMITASTPKAVTATATAADLKTVSGTTVSTAANAAVDDEIGGRDDVAVNMVGLTGLSKVDQMFVRVNEADHPDVRIAVSELASITHEANLELTCCALTCISWSERDDMCKRFIVYLGTGHGKVLQFKFA